MNEKCCFDKDLIRNTIVLGNEKLLNKNMSNRFRKILCADIKILEGFLNDNYDIDDYCMGEVSVPLNIDKLKDFVLNKMRKQYYVLGEDFIKFIIDMSDTDLFDDRIISFVGSSNLTMDEKIELTIKNYEKNSPRLLTCAKELLLDKKIGQIQVANGYGSYCHYDNISRMSFIVLDECSESCVLNHEVEHAIESYMCIDKNVLYGEVGSILYEMLFNDELYNSKGFLDNYNFDFRLNNTRMLLDEVALYFRIMLYFSSIKFNVPTDIFWDTFMKHDNGNKNILDNYLIVKVMDDSIINGMKYLFSFLKAVELKEIFYNDREEGYYMLLRHLKNKKFYFKIPQDRFGIYERYVLEMEEKVRKKVRMI